MRIAGIRVPGWLARWVELEPRQATRRARRPKLGGLSWRARLTRPDQYVTPFEDRHIESVPDPLRYWRDNNLDSATLSRVSTAKLVELLADVSPEVSRAVWDWLRFVNPGYEVTVTRPGSDDVWEQGQAAVEGMIEQLEGYHGTFMAVIGRLVIGGYLRGAFLAELILDEQGRAFVDIATPDPASVSFQKMTDPVRGTVWQLGQWQAQNFVPLETETVKYIPIDPLPGSPFGRALVTPSVMGSLFLIALLRDLRRVVQQQGYPRLDLSVSLEAIEEMLPDNLDEDSDEYATWVNDTIQEVVDAYALLEPEDAYVHTDAVTVNKPVGTIGADSLGVIDDLIRALERMVIRGLKTMPLLMGSNEAVAETHANRQWEIYMAGVKAIQGYLVALLDYIFTLALQAQGLQAEVSFVFKELRESERLRDAETEAQIIINAWNKYQAGYISLDQASEEVTGSPADQAEPRAQLEQPGQATMATRAVQIVPDGSDAPLPPLPQEVVVTEADAIRAQRLWDRLMPTYEGLLAAQVEGQADFDEEGPFELPGGPSEWVYQVTRQRYLNTETGETLNRAAILALRDDFVRIARERSPAISHTRQTDLLVDQMTEGLIDLQRFVLEMRREVLDAYTNAYQLAKGGNYNMTQSDWGRIGNMMAPDGKYQAIQDYADKIADGQKTPGQIRAWAKQQISSSVQAFERGNDRGLRLPEYPADGNQDCFGNCKCNWRIVETEEAWECYWELNKAEHCRKCLLNEARWSPLIIPKTEAATLGQLALVLNGKQKNAAY